MQQRTIVLVAFYNVKALGVRYLESALVKAGWRVVTVLYKGFNSVHPQPTTACELALLTDIITHENPALIGLSVMSSMYLDTVHQVLDAAQQTGVPVACGGAYATMFPAHFLDRGARYVIRKEIGLPFTIWSHPKMVDAETLRKLVAVGLTEVIMGIQSGSPHIRRDIFHRYETQRDILGATRMIKESGVFWASYDFMVQHPFETTDDLRQSYDLVKQMHGRFELQLHGLNFLPCTDIVDMAITQGYLTADEMESIMYAPMDAQFGAYWQRTGDPENMLWYQMLYYLQFRGMRKKLERFEGEPAQYSDEIGRLYARAQHLFRLRYYYKKAYVLLKSKLPH